MNSKNGTISSCLWLDHDDAIKNVNMRVHAWRAACARANTTHTLTCLEEDYTLILLHLQFGMVQILMLPLQQ